MFNVLLFFIFMLSIFGILCITYFKGSLSTCTINSEKYENQLKNLGKISKYAKHKTKNLGLGVET